MGRLRGHFPHKGSIEITHDLPGVGANLQDHYQTRFAYRCTEAITVNDILRKRKVSERHGASVACIAQHRRALRRVVGGRRSALFAAEATEAADEQRV